MMNARRRLMVCIFLMGMGLANAARASICRNPDFFEQCPTADPAFATIIHDFKIRKNGVLINPATLTCTAPVSAIPISAWTDDLVVLQSLRAIYYMDKGRHGHLPWTPGTLYDWLRAGVGGIDISTTATYDHWAGQAYAAQGDTANYFVVRAKNDTTRDFQRKWAGIATFIALMSHERRHGDPGFGFHVRCCPGQDPSNPNNACDQTYQENANLSPYGIQYWLIKNWISGNINVTMGCLSPADKTEAVNFMRGEVNMRANPATSAFCSNTPPVLTDANDPVAPCPRFCGRIKRIDPNIRTKPPLFYNPGDPAPRVRNPAAVNPQINKSMTVNPQQVAH